MTPVALGSGALGSGGALTGPTLTGPTPTGLTPTGLTLAIFPVAGEALGFAVRRFRTIMRVAWLPVTLLLIVQMAAVFALISVDFGRLFSFADLVNGARFANAKAYAFGVIRKGLAAGDIRIYLILAATLATNLALTASFMAPLIRFAGLGERPAEGLFRAAFGPDQARYSLATLASGVVAPIILLVPILFAVFGVIQHVETAMAATFVSFPNPDSLHAIRYTSAVDVMTARGDLWLYEYGRLGLVAIGAALLAGLFGAAHFRRPGGALGSEAISVVLSLAGVAVLLFLILIPLTDNFKDGLVNDVSAFGLAIAAAIVLTVYGGLRLFPYAGLAVCRRSMGFTGLGRLTRRFNLLRLAASLSLLGAILWVINLIVTAYGFPLLAQTLSVILETTEAYGRLINGEASDRARPFVIWMWAVIQVVYQIIWSFFSYGVLAGLFGRLYRDSLRTADDVHRPVAQGSTPPWRRRPTGAAHPEVTGSIATLPA